MSTVAPRPEDRILVQLTLACRWFTIKVDSQSAFRRYSYPLTYSTFCRVTAWIQNGLNICFVTHLLTVPHNDKVKTCFYKCLQMYWKLKAEISNSHKYSLPSQYFVEAPLEANTALSRLGYVCISFESSWVCLYQLCTSGLCNICQFILQALSNWLMIMARQPFSCLAIDFQVDLSQNCNSALISNFSVDLALCFRLLSCWKVNLSHSVWWKSDNHVFLCA